MPIILIGLCFHPIFSQTKKVHGTVVDQLSREPVPYVHVFSSRNATGTITDLNGNFTLILNPAGNDSLRFSSIGYKTQRIAVIKFTDNKKVIIDLEEDRIMLPGFTVHALSAKELVRKSISKIPVNYIQSANGSKAFYWNSVNHDDIYTDFYEGYLSLSKGGKIFNDSTVTSIKSREQILLFDSLQDILHFDVINKTSMFVNPANLNDWKFSYAYSSEHYAESFIIIEATMFDNPFSKSEEFSKLKLHIHAKSLAIVRVDFAYRWTNGKRYNWKDDVQFTLSSLNGTVEYAKGQEQLHRLAYLFIRSEFSFMKKYNPTILKTAVINHELVTFMPDQTLYEKPVVRWGDYLDATKLLPNKHTPVQD